MGSCAGAPGPRRFLCAATLAVLLAPAAANAEPPAHQAPALSFQGYSGLFNIPNAEVTPFGVGMLQWSNQVEVTGLYDTGDNYHLSLGLFPHVEIGGRIADNRPSGANLFQESFDGPGMRDLSFDAKVQSPWRLPGGASIAIGAQDPAGEAQQFTSEYLVATQPLGPARLSLGYGRSDSPLPRLDGAFGGIEYGVTNWLDLVAEHDADTANAGFRLRHDGHLRRMPWGVDVAVQARSAASEREDVFAALGVRFPIGLSGPASEQPPAVPRNRDLPPRVELADTAPGSAPDADTAAILDALGDTLAAHGFENIHIGTAAGGVLHLRVGNAVFNRNDMDALGVALGEAAQAAQGRFDTIRLVLTRNGIATTGIEVPAQAYADWLAGEGERAPADLRQQARMFDPATQRPPVRWHRRGIAAGWFRPRFILQPVLTYGVATDAGRFDYSAALRTEGRLPMWPGGQLVVAGTTNSTNSDAFEEGGAFAQQRIDSGITEAVLQQAARVGPVHAQASAGRFRRDYDGALGEAYLHLGRDRHRLGGRLGHFEHKDSDIDFERDLALASYRYDFRALDTAVEFTTGRFWAQDEGWLLETHHRFRDATVTLFAKHTAADFVGIRFTVPLSPRRDMAARPVQVRGESRWRFDLQTRVREDQNIVDFATADALRRPSDLDRQYLNDSRHGETYQRRHFDRLGEAFRRYGSD